MVNVIEKQIRLFGKPIYAQMTQTDEGIQVLVAGGDKAHIGAVTAVDESGEKHTLTLPGHKETVIAEKWAGELFAKSQAPVVATAGIHYDDITAEQIKTVLQTMDELLKDMLLYIKKQD